MAFPRPTLSALVASLRERFRTEFIAAGKPLEAFVRNTTTWVLTRVWGDALHNLYGLMEYASRQILPTTADEDYLLQHGEVFGVDRLQPVKSTGSVLLGGVNGTVVAPGVQLVRADGTLYVTTSGGTIAATILLVDAEAQAPGAAANVGGNTAVSLVTPLAGVTGAFLVGAPTPGWTNGADLEGVEAYRERVLFRRQRPPQGGASVDYVAWARLVAGVTRVWVQPLGRGAGTVDVYFLHEGGSGIGIPTSGQIADVQASLDANRPVVADALALAPTTVAVDFTIAISPDNAGNRTAVETELDALFLLRAGSGGTINVSDYWAALTPLIGAGLDSLDITSPVSGITPAVGEVAVRGTITWV